LNVESLNELSIYQKYEHLRREGLTTTQALTEASESNKKTDEAMANLEAVCIQFDIIKDLSMNTTTGIRWSNSR
jgi:hypothetical protein